MNEIEYVYEVINDNEEVYLPIGFCLTEQSARAFVMTLLQDHGEDVSECDDSLGEIVIRRHTVGECKRSGEYGVEIERWEHTEELVDYADDPAEPIIHIWTSSTGLQIKKAVI